MKSTRESSSEINSEENSSLIKLKENSSEIDLERTKMRSTRKRTQMRCMKMYVSNSETNKCSSLCIEKLLSENDEVSVT